MFDIDDTNVDDDDVDEDAEDRNVEDAAAAAAASNLSRVSATPLRREGRREFKDAAPE